MTGWHEWLKAAPGELFNLMARLAKHNRIDWGADDSGGDPKDSRVQVDDWEHAETFSSLVTERRATDLDALFDDVKEGDGLRFHQVVVDVDVPAWLVPSSTEGHHHLYVQLAEDVPEDKYFAWLEASAEIGLLQGGYVNACMARGMTSVRAPWIKKPQMVEKPKEASDGQSEVAG